MSLIDDVVIVLGSYHDGYKLMRKRMHGYTGPADFSRIKTSLDAKENTLRVTLTRLKQRCLVENSDGIWSLTRKGMAHLRDRVAYLNENPHARWGHKRDGKRFAHTKKKDMIIAFDIPEKYKKKRHWLRVELVALGFSQLQKSVWFGPSPIPEDFLNAVDELDILDCLKFFKASEYDIV